MFTMLRHWVARTEVIPVVRLEGQIRAGKQPGILSHANTRRVLSLAFSFKRARAVALIINSPGGSPAQSHLIARHIIQLRQQSKIPVYAFVEDTGASGGYMLALGCDEIYSDPFSLIGSIGVISGSFGLTRAMEKLGVERRVTTAGENKSFLDPFQPQTDADKEKLRKILASTHELFKSFVRERRGKRLKEEGNKLFEGDVWLASEAEKLGLIDGVGGMSHILEKKFGKDVRLLYVTPPRVSPFELLSSMESSAKEIASVMQEMAGSSDKVKL